MPALNRALPQTTEFAAWTGLDRADRKHFWSPRTAAGQLTAAGLIRWVVNDPLVPLSRVASDPLKSHKLLIPR
jgi:hypothetical protein